jgi:hypothetical protein
MYINFSLPILLLNPPSLLLAFRAQSGALPVSGPVLLYVDIAEVAAERLRWLPSRYEIR